MAKATTKRSPIGPIIGAVVVIGIIVVAFAPLVTRAYSVSFTTSTITSQVNAVPLTTTTVQTSVIATSAVNAVTTTSTQTTTIFSITSYTIGVCGGVYQTATLQTGEAVSATWRAQANVDVYLFSQSQFAAYNSSGTTTAMASQTGASSGTIGFIVSFSGTYYILIHNPSCGILGIGGSTVGLYSATGTVIYPQVVTSYSTSYYNTALLITSTSYYTTYTTVYGASTYTTTSTTSCTINLLTDLSSSKC